jgi:glycosyltransferase involved in cell wall biosynthesis
MRLLYYLPTSYGGIADYAHEQANVLVDIGHDVTLLTTLEYPMGRGERYQILPQLQEIKAQKPFTHKVLKGLHYVNVTLANNRELEHVIQQQGFQKVLLGSYSEYLAPLWARGLRRLARQGVVFGAILHDPVRDFVVGPRWWHRWSIAQGYSFLREAFVHEAIALDTIRPMPQMHTTVIPHGVYHFPSATLSREAVRSHLKLPLDAKVMLAFGHLRLNKNLDLVIRAMASVPEIYLVVAGSESSSSQPLAPGYQALAQELGVGDRIRWQIRFIPDGEIADFFIASDLTVLTYRQTFCSASGVLNTAIQYQKPCLASGGEGWLPSVIRRYHLGLWITPDHVSAIADGLKQWLCEPPNPQWDLYQQENSWQRNAELTINAFNAQRI